MARRSIWKGAVTFGMVAIPAKLYSATEDTDISLHQYHKECGSRISMPRYCSTCQKMLTGADITKGYEVGDSYVPLSEADFQSLPLKSVKTIEVVEFVDESQVDLRCYDKPYFLGSDEGGYKAYRLFVIAMADAKLAAVAKLCYRERERLSIVRPYHGVMLLQTLRYAEELKDCFDLKPPEYAISNKELDLAVSLVKAMAVPQFDLTKYHDEYRQALEKLIEAKIAGEVLPVAQETPIPVSDVADALLASLKLAEAKRQ
ncbi:MAG: Ku protein [Chloroflexi bacterium]|nr:Ku protein [Chloroflexota bacterium]